MSWDFRGKLKKWLTLGNQWK